MSGSVSPSARLVKGPSWSSKIELSLGGPRTREAWGTAGMLLKKRRGREGSGKGRGNGEPEKVEEGGSALGRDLGGTDGEREALLGAPALPDTCQAGRCRLTWGFCGVPSTLTLLMMVLVTMVTIFSYFVTI